MGRGLGRLPGEHVGGAEGIFEDLAGFGGAYEALVGSLIPADARLFPVAPQAVGLNRGNYPVHRAGEDGPALVRYYWLQRERGDGAKQCFERLLADAFGAKRMGGDGERVGPEKVRGIDRRVSGYHAVEVLFKRGEQGDGVAA